MKQQSLLSMWGAKPKARKVAAGGKENARKQQRVAQQSTPAAAPAPAEPPRAPAEPAPAEPPAAAPPPQAQPPTEDIPVERPAGAEGIDRSSGALARAADPVQRARAAAAAAQATVVLPAHDGLSQYERERLGRIARNEAFMQSLGLGGGLAGARACLTKAQPEIFNLCAPS